MTMTADTTRFTSPGAALSLSDGVRVLGRLAQCLFGAALALAAPVFWLAPGQVWQAEFTLGNVAMTLMVMVAGLGLLTFGRTPLPPVAEIDTRRREVRLLKIEPDGSARVLERVPFAHLMLAEHQAGRVWLWGRGETLLADVTLEDDEVLHDLLDALRAEGRLA